jgi:hypothetical protein
VSDISDIANTDNLPFIKYYMTNREWRSFCSGQLSGSDSFC